MTYYHDGDDRLSNSDVGQEDRFDELTMRGLYESPHLESDCLGARLDNTGELMMAARREPEYDEFGLEIEGTGNYELDAYWVGASLRTTQARDVDPMDLTDEDLTGLPLEAQERLHGLREERKRQREKALATHVVGIDRETRRRDELLEEYGERRADYNERVVGAGIHRYDPFETLDEETTKAVREVVTRIEDHLITAPNHGILEHRLACKVARGQDLFTAQSNTLDELYQEPGIIQPIASVPIIPSKYNVEADIQGEVTTLWQPKSRSQQQVGLIKDAASDTIKFTVWTRSNQGVILHEGDTVRIIAGKVGKYQGQATLAADSETRIEVLVRGDGPAPRGDIPNVDWEKYAKRNHELGIEHPFQRHVACSIPPLGTPGVEEVSRPVHLPADRLDHEKSDEMDALEWLKATEIFDEDGKIPLPTWWREQANVISVIIDTDADGDEIGTAIRDAVSTSQPESTPVPVTPVPEGKRRLWALVRNLDLFGIALENDSETAPNEETTPTQTEASELTGVATPNASETTATSDTTPNLGLPTTACRCPECAHDRAHYRLVQLRSIDEPPTRLLSCTSCGQRWREDS
jgi:DNA-directed RNA polymerase subunit M/transcription elongation factor TFIIS